MDDEMREYWEGYLNADPSGEDVYVAMTKNKDLQESGWEYLRSSGKLDRQTALGVMIFCPDLGKKAMSYLGHFTKHEAVIAIQSGTRYADDAYRTIGNDTGALMQLLYSDDEHVVNKAMGRIGRDMSTSQLMELMTRSGIGGNLEDKVKTFAWNKVNTRNLSDDDLLEVVRKAPESYRGNAAGVLYSRTSDDNLREEMRGLLADSGNTNLMNNEEKREYFKRKLGF